MNTKVINLTQVPEPVTCPETHYVYLEKVGDFKVMAPQAWAKFHQSIPAISKHNKITGYLSLYKCGPQMIYRAGVAVDSKPIGLPKGVQYEKIKGGRYVRFILTGPYSELPEANGRAFEIIFEKGIQMRDDYCIENCISNPETTPQDELVTHILIPTT